MRDMFLIITAGCTALLLESLLISVINYMLKPNGARRITIIPIDEECGSFEKIIRWHLLKMDTDPLSGDSILLIVGSESKDENYEIARRICSERKNCRLCSETEATAIIGDGICKGVELVLY